jgi:hypothetical protein
MGQDQICKIVRHLKKRYGGKKIASDNNNYFIQFIDIQRTSLGRIQVIYQYCFRVNRDKCDFDDFYKVIDQIRTYYHEKTYFYERD